MSHVNEITNILKINQYFKNKYSYNHKKGFLWYSEYYEIVFDDTVIHIVDTKQDASQLCALLNGAYLIGYLDSKMTYENFKIVKDTKEPI